jgi:hypothetical protein
MWQTLSLIASFAWWLIQRPQVILYAWLVMWAGLLYASAQSLGVMNAVQFALNSLFNIGSMLGLPIPMMAIALMSIRYIVPMILKFIVRGALMLWKAVQAEALNVGKKIKKATAGIKKVAKKATSKMRLGEAYVGSGNGADDPVAELEASVNELSAALAAIGM